MPARASIIIEPAAGDEVPSIAARIPGDPAPLVILLGDADAAVSPLVRSFLNRAVIPAAAACGARIVDNGTDSGLAALTGQAVRDAEKRPVSIGVAPHGADVEPNHAIVVRLPADWPGDPVRTMLEFTGVLAKDPNGSDKPVMVVIAGGGDAEKAALVTCVRRQWPILLIGETGGIADAILVAMKPGANGQRNTPSDPDVREIVETGDVESFSLSDSFDDPKRILFGRIDLRVDSMADAWRRFAALDKAAFDKQVDFRKIQRIILGLGVAATFLAIVQSGGALTWLRQLLPPDFAPYYPGIRGFVHLLMVITPVVISVLVAVNSRFREGNKWILLRAAAEAIKREIFRYRMQAGVYRDAQCGGVTREIKLASQLSSITSGLSQSEVNRTSLPVMPDPKAKLLTFLKPDGYFEERIDDQIQYYTEKIEKLCRQLKKFQIWIYVFGGAGTLLAAFKFDVWVALTIAIAALLATRLEMDQVESTIIQYNQALTGLKNVSSWWKALSKWEKERSANIDLLVDQTETTLAGELAGWVQQMQSALDKLTEKEQAQGKDKPNA